ncbi:MAG: hypothetical protein GYA73_07545, partial [Planctomycetes bacterium]|nr:hypothetical protein [Planctomycetota bacterium]
RGGGLGDARLERISQGVEGLLLAAFGFRGGFGGLAPQIGDGVGGGVQTFVDAVLEGLGIAALGLLMGREGLFESGDLLPDFITEGGERLFLPLELQVEGLEVGAGNDFAHAIQVG